MTKKKELSPELKAECDAAKALFISRKNTLGLTQAKLAEAADISPAGVAMYLNGTNPLNAKFAAVLSRLIGLPVDRFSPRLANEISRMTLGVKAPGSAGGLHEEDSTNASLKNLGKNKEVLVPPVARFIIWAANQGRLSAEDLSEIYRTASYLVSKNAAPGGAVDLPDHLDGLAEAALRAAEQGGNPEDLLKMVGHGLNRAQPKEGQLKDGKRKASSS